jgi:hypothetical protein
VAGQGLAADRIGKFGNGELDLNDVLNGVLNVELDLNAQDLKADAFSVNEPGSAGRSVRECGSLPFAKSPLRASLIPHSTACRSSTPMAPAHNDSGP